MASRNVTVLAPNGRRQTVKCTLNTTILQILEEVCKKQDFEPSKYDIKHHNKVLDTSMTVQFSGLPNNAQLELSPATKMREESEVTVALNFEDGRRVQGTFMPSTTLIEMLTSLCDNHEPNPVVIYTRREIFGEDLMTTDLRSLGLTRGRAMFRIIHRAPEELKFQANVSSILPSKPVEEKPYKRVFQPIDSLKSEDLNASNAEKNENLIHNIISPEPKNLSAQTDILKLAKERQKSEEKEKLTNESNSEEKIIKDKGRTIKKQGKQLNFESETSENKTYDHANSDIGESYKQKLETIKLDDFPFIGERNALIFPLESAQPSRLVEDPPDEFFNLTIDDAKTILRDIRKKREEIDEGGPLLTAALRQLEESKKQLRQLNRYSKSIIRVLFPDRTVLQAVFSSTDLVKTVSEFVQKHLHNSNIPFHLYTTPPKHILPEDKRLIEVDCVPGALLHFGTDDQYKNNEFSFLREDLKGKYTTNSMASLAALKIREETKRSKEDVIDNSYEEKSIAGCSKESSPSTGNPVKRNSNTTEKLPKWFKGT
ncbi:hypothetical protein HHI36_014929 [Cryptolaemus montrouzieri]|uniref:UBX domain-containing protein n=1 Tax=Cryptolaemus montrouzieri TaxID=559131 RepID=A0ABD2N4G1_9CUCU